MLEQVQKFALRMVTKHLDFNYDALLDVVNIDSLESCREEVCLCLLYKFINNICYFDSVVFTFSNTRSYHSHSGLSVAALLCSSLTAHAAANR